MWDYFYQKKLQTLYIRKSGLFFLNESQFMNTPLVVRPQDKRAFVPITQVRSLRGVPQGWGAIPSLGETPPLRQPCSQQLPRSAPTRTSQNAICPVALTPGKGPLNYPFLVLVPSLPALLLAKEPAMALTSVSFFPSTATFYFLLPSCITAMPMEVKSPSGKRMDGVLGECLSEPP